jgi:hypothetical protein
MANTATSAIIAVLARTRGALGKVSDSGSNRDEEAGTGMGTEQPLRSEKQQLLDTGRERALDHVLCDREVVCDEIRWERAVGIDAADAACREIQFICRSHGSICSGRVRCTTRRSTVRISQSSRPKRRRSAELASPFWAATNTRLPCKSNNNLGGIDTSISL